MAAAAAQRKSPSVSSEELRPVVESRLALLAFRVETSGPEPRVLPFKRPSRSQAADEQLALEDEILGQVLILRFAEVYQEPMG